MIILNYNLFNWSRLFFNKLGQNHNINLCTHKVESSIELRHLRVPLFPVNIDETASALLFYSKPDIFPRGSFELPLYWTLKYLYFSPEALTNKNCLFRD